MLLLLAGVDSSKHLNFIETRRMEQTRSNRVTVSLFSKQISNYSIEHWQKLSHLHFFSFGERFPCFWTLKPASRVFKAHPLRVDNFVRDDRFLSYCLRYSVNTQNAPVPPPKLDFQTPLDPKKPQKMLVPKTEPRPSTPGLYIFNSTPKKPKSGRFPNALGHIRSERVDWGTHLTCSLYLGTESGNVLEVDAVTRELLAVVKLHESGIQCLHFAWNQRLLTFASDGRIRIWDSDLASLVNEIQLGYSVTSLSVSVNLDLRYFAMGSPKQTWLGLRARPHKVSRLHLVSSSNFIGSFDFVKGKMTKQCHSDEAPVLDWALDPVAQLLVFVNANKKISIFKLPSMTLEYEFFCIERTPASLAIMRRPEEAESGLLVGYKEGFIELVSLQTWKVTASCDIQEQLTFKSTTSQSQRDLSQDKQAKIKYLFSPRKKKGPKRNIKVNLKVSRLLALDKASRIVAQIREDFILVMTPSLEIAGTLAVYNVYDAPIRNFLLTVDDLERKLVHSFDDFSLSLNCLQTAKSKSYIETESKIVDCAWGRGDSFVLALTSGNTLNFYKKNTAKGVFDYLSSLVDKYKQIGEEMIIEEDRQEYLTRGARGPRDCKAVERDEKLQEIRRFLHEELQLGVAEIEDILDAEDDTKLIDLYNRVLRRVAAKTGDGKRGKSRAGHGAEHFQYDLHKIVNLSPSARTTETGRVNWFRLEMLLCNIDSKPAWAESTSDILSTFAGHFKREQSEQAPTQAPERRFRKIAISPNNEFVFLLSESGSLIISDFFCSGKNLVNKQVGATRV